MSVPVPAIPAYQGPRELTASDGFGPLNTQPPQPRRTAASPRAEHVAHARHLRSPVRSLSGTGRPAPAAHLLRRASSHERRVVDRTHARQHTGHRTPRPLSC
jgi:hypothetical protein